VALAYLASERHRPVPRDELADVVWGEELPGSWEQMLRGLALKIRRALGEGGIDGAAALVTVAGTLQLRLPADVVVDTEEAAAALAAAQTAVETGDAAQADAQARQATEVAARQFAPGAVGVWVERRQAELRELHLSALEVRAHAALAVADWQAAVTVAEEALALDRYRESAYQLLMAAHAGAGSRGEALATYERCRRVLAEELGVSPSAATEAAYLRLLGDEAPPAVAALAPLALPAAVAAPPGSFVVGREAECEALVVAFKRATVEGRRAVLVGGEPGVGKTTLVAHAALVAHAQGARILYGRCDEDLGVPYQPFAQALSQYVLTAPIWELTDHVAAHGGEALRLVPALGRRLPGTPPPPPVDADTARWRLFEAVVGLLATAAMAAPVVVVLDDLHWATPATLQLLRHALSQTADERILLLGTYRHSEIGPDHPLTATLADLRRVPGVERVTLDGLDRAGVEAFIVATRDAAPDELAPLGGALWAQTAGNPFFLGELLRDLDETHAMPLRDGAWRSDDGAIDVPAGVVEVVGRRLARLSPTTNRVLTVASVIGAEFDLDVVERAVAEADADLALDGVEEASAAQLVVEAGAPGAYRFRHGLVRDALYGNLGAVRRARLHRRVGEAIEALPGEAGDRLPALAHHFAEAAATGCIDQAADYALAAADHFLRIPAADAAVATLQRAVKVFDARRAGDDERRTALLLKLLTFQATLEHLLGRHDVAHDLLLRGLEAVPGTASTEAAVLKLELSVDALYRGDFAAQHAWGNDARQTAGVLKNEVLQACSAAVLAYGDYSVGAVQDGITHAEEAAALIDRLDDVELGARLDTMYFLGWSEYFLERFENAIRHLRRGTSVAGSTGKGHLLGPMMLGEVMALTARGQLSAAKDVVESAVDAARISTNPQALSWALFESCWVSAHAGDFVAALAAGEEAVALTRDLDENILSRAARTHLAWAYVHAGDPERCIQLMTEAGAPEFPFIEPARRAFWYEVLSQAELARENLQAASRWASRADGLGLPVAGGAATRARAAAEMWLGNLVRATELALAAANDAAEAEAPIEAARSRLLAGLALALGGKREEAIVQLGVAERELVGCGAAGFRDQAARALRWLGRPVRMTSTVLAPSLGTSQLASGEAEITEARRLWTNRPTDR
jgi:DNA-binding SARP family transcriptional activator